MFTSKSSFLRFFNDDAPAGGSGGGDDAKQGEDKGTDKGADDGDKGFPAGTPISDMTAEQQAAYWKHQSRKHENQVKALGDVEQLRDKAKKFDELKNAGRTPEQKSIDEARADERAKVEAEWKPRLAETEVKSELRAQLSARGVTGATATAVIEPLSMKNFLTTTGEVDTDKVSTYVDSIAPKGGKWPDMGQGNRGSDKKPTGVAAGRAMWDAQHKKQ